MKILMLHPHDLYTEPWTIRIIKFAEVFAGEGHDVTLAYFPSQLRRKKGLFVRQKLPAEMTYLELGRDRTNFLTNLALLEESASLADVIHVQKSYATAFVPALVLSRRYRTPLHYDWDDDESAIAPYWTSRFNCWKIAAWERLAPIVATTVSVASVALREMAMKYGARKKMVVDAPVGADLQEFDRRRDRSFDYPHVPGVKQWVLYVGQLEGANYASLLIDAVRSIGKLRKDVALLIVGGGFGKESLEKQAAEAGVADRIFFTGYVPHESIPAIMSRADVAIACLENTRSARAKSPLKVVEYMAAGLPVVGTDVGEIPRMLEGSGIIVPPDAPRAIAEAVIDLLGDEERRKSLGKMARNKVLTKYNWDASAKNLMDAYESGISKFWRYR
jgi:glycosyltransferase involved in cell wall biosynthesis